MKTLEPFIPTPTDPWDAQKAAHLARRAGFGARPGELAELVELGVEGAVDSLVDFPAVDERLVARIERAGSALALFEGAGRGDPVDPVRRRWLFRMVHGGHPLQEKLTLFWHDHFATQQSKVLRGHLVQTQLELLRRHAAGSFRDMIRGIARDPAMLVMLDNRLSEARNPNENWARELLELYTLGLDRYSQEDVVELARIFTGWTTPLPHVVEFVFRPPIHDPRDKVLFGHTIRGRRGADGLQEGDEALELVLQRPECATFLAGKLCAWFVAHDPDPEPVEALAAVLRAADYSVREALRRLFRSAWFFAPEHRFGLYKNPVELAVGTLRLLGVQNAHLAGLERLTHAMGMRLYEPPSVAGWEPGAGWVDSGAVVQRFNFALEVSQLPHTSRQVDGRPAVDLDALAGEEDPAHGDLVDRLTARLVQRPLRPGPRAALVEYLDQAGSRLSREAPLARRRRAKTRAAIHLILTTPEYALA